MRWFTNIKSTDELRKKYRELLKLYHPDCENGNSEITQEINTEYNTMFEILKTSNNNFETSKEDDNTFKAVLNEIISLDITVEIIGSWIWVFNAYSHRDKLKELGFSWNSKKKVWIWHSKPYKKHSKKEISLNDIRDKYGSKTVKRYINRNICKN